VATRAWEGDAGAGGDAGMGGSGGSSAGGGGSGACEEDNQGPTAVLPESIEGSAGQEIVLDASASSDPEQGPLEFSWEPLSEAPPPASTDGAKATVQVKECGDYTYRVTVTDACGAKSEATVVVKVATGGYVAKNTCTPSTACGGVSNPWCNLQEAIDKTKGALVIRAANGVYGAVSLREGVSLEGGYDDTFSSRSAIPDAQKTVIETAGGSALRGPPGGASFVDGILLRTNLAVPQVSLAMIAQQQGALTLRNLRVEGGPVKQTVSHACGIERVASSSGALVLEDAVEVTGLDAVESSTALCLEGSGEVNLSGATLQGGKAARSAAVDAAFLGSFKVSKSILTGGIGSVRAVGLRWLVAGAGADLTLDKTLIRGGQGPEVVGLDLEGVGAVTIQGGEVRGEEDGGSGSLLGVGIRAVLVGGGGVPGLTLSGVAVVGASVALERVGLLANRTRVKVEGGTIDGSLTAGGRRVVGVRFEGGEPGAVGLVLDKCERIGGGAPSGQGGKYEAFGVELASEAGAVLIGNKQVAGCTSFCKADFPGSMAAGVRGLQGNLVLEKNEMILGGPQQGGLGASTSRHAGVRMEGGSLKATGNKLLAGNLVSDSLPGEVLGVDSQGTVALSGNTLVGGYGVSLAAGLVAAGGKESKVLSNVLRGGAAKVAFGARTTSQKAMLFSVNTVNACGVPLEGPDGGACKTVEQSTGLVSHSDVNSKFSNNYVLGGFGASSTGCELGNNFEQLGGEGAAQFVYNLCFGLGRTKTKEPTTEAVGVRLVGLGGQKVHGLLLLNNIFLAGNMTAERYGGVEGAAEQLTVRNNDFFLISSPIGLGPGSAYYKRGAQEIDDLPTLNQSSPNWTFDKNVAKDPKFKAPLGDFTNLTAAGLHLDSSCALLNQGIVTNAETNDFDGEVRGTNKGDGFPEIGPDECP
jgi:hypothetical protein